MMPFRKILFAVDFSDAALAMAPTVNEMAQRFGAAVTVLHAFDLAPDYILIPRFEDSGENTPTAIPYTPEFQKLRSEREQRLEDFSHAQFPDVRATPRIEDGEPAMVIDWVAQQENSDLIMMPTKGLGKFRRLLLGSVTAKVLHDVKCPVLTSAHESSPAVTSFTGYRSIICAVGLSAHSEAALRLTGVLAQTYGAKICLLHIDEFAEDGAASSVEEMRNAFDSATGIDSREVLNISARVLADAIPEGIRRVVLDQAADLVIVGRGHARGSISRAWSHLYAIIREAPCPVLSV